MSTIVTARRAPGDKAPEKATKKEVKAIAVINDIDKEIKDEYLDALNSKNADYFLWSKRNEAETMGKLAAA